MKTKGRNSVIHFQCGKFLSTAADFTQEILFVAFKVKTMLRLLNLDFQNNNEQEVV